MRSRLGPTSREISRSARGGVQVDLGSLSPEGPSNTRDPRPRVCGDLVLGGSSAEPDVSSPPVERGVGSVAIALPITLHGKPDRSQGSELPVKVR
jgi:hypothetical protein